MICSKEEFLLLLQKWMSSSQRVVVTLSFGSLPLSRLATVRISGLIQNLDEEEELFTLVPDSGSFPEGDHLTIGIDPWIFAYGDQREYSSAFGPDNFGDGADEIVLMRHPNGIIMALFTLKPPS
jgi:hypothetical protein